MLPLLYRFPLINIYARNIVTIYVNRHTGFIQRNSIAIYYNPNIVVYIVDQYTEMALPMIRKMLSSSVTWEIKYG